MLYGRDGERVRIGELLQAARKSQSGALVVRGEPGIGKSALLEDTQERATDMHVLTARGIESESELPFAALHQLLRSALGYVERIPEPQANALRGALGIAEASTTERFLVSAACLSLLSELSERRPVLCLIDDAHWLDTATADALLFVARRLDAEGILMIFAAREGDVRSFEATGIPSLDVEGLDSESAATLLARGAGSTIAPSVVERLVEQTHGNALALLEVPAALTPQQLEGSDPLPEALPLTRRVEQIFLERFHTLPVKTQRLLLVAAADDTGELALLIRAAKSVGADDDALDAAEQSRLVTVHGTRLDFRHPLVRSAVYEAATSAQRRSAHRALAEALGEDAEHADRRAWHLAASTLEADEAIAEAVERVAERAEARAGYASAARALERAVELSAVPEARRRRLIAAAKAASIAGLDLDAVRLANQAQSFAATPEERADVAYVLGLAEIRGGHPAKVFTMLLDAARELAPVDPGKAIELCMHAMAAASAVGNDAGQLESAKLAASIVAPPEHDRARIITQFVTGFAADVEGDPRAISLLADGVSMAMTTQDPYSVFMASVGALVAGDDKNYETLLTRAISLARAAGEIGTLAEALAVRAPLLLMLQRFDEAERAAEEAVQLTDDLRAENHALMPLAVLAAVAALRGQDADARRWADHVLAVATPRGLIVRAGLATAALGWLELGRGRWDEALEHFDAAARVNSVSAVRVAPDRVEAAIRAGRRDVAERVTARFEDWFGETEAPWARPRVASCKALLAHGAEATEQFEEAVRLEADARPFDRGRIHLLYGEHLRRERRRADARVHLRRAIEEFEQFRAAPWVERAVAELRATGETARKRDPSTFDQLTPQEIQICKLVAEGMSNKEIAAQLFLSPRTIDYHLRNVFAKLGLTSRTQLARFALDDREEAASQRAVGAAT